MPRAILFTMPGRHGDILWAMPTVRALAERFSTTVSLVLSPKYASLGPLLGPQPYVESIIVDGEWEVQETAPMTPVRPSLRALGAGHGLDAHEYDAVLYGGYTEWPHLPLPYEIAANVSAQLGGEPLTIDLARPWIDTPRSAVGGDAVVVGFTDEWFELKFGLTVLLSNWQRCNALVAPESRWNREAFSTDDDFGLLCCEWRIAAGCIGRSRVFLGCCSALHVLAVAMGIPVVLMEPNPHRHHDIFYPLGKTGPQVTLVTGNDGLPTFDARHCADAVKAVLAR